MQAYFVKFKKVLLMLMTLMLLSASAWISFGDNLKIQTINSKTLKSIDGVLKKGEGPFQITGRLVLGKADGVIVSDDVFCFSRKITPRYNFDQAGDISFALKGSPKMTAKGSYFVDYEVGLYKNGNLIRTMYSSGLLSENKMKGIRPDVPITDFDSVKYKCTLYSKAQLSQVPKSYTVERLSLPADLPKIVGALEQAYGFTYNRWYEGNNFFALEEQEDMYLNEDRYVDADGSVHYFDLNVKTFSKNEKFEFSYTEEHGSDFDQCGQVYTDGVLNTSSRPTTTFYCNAKDTTADLRLYRPADNNRGYLLDKVYLISGQVEPSEWFLNAKAEAEAQRAADANRQAIQFADPNFEAVVRNAINKPSGTIYDADVLKIKNLDASSKNIVSIEGIQYLKMLNIVRLDNNQIKDISPLAGLTNLMNVYLGKNQISDISAFKNLKKLQVLEFYDNQIHDISVLSDKTNLRFIIYSGNPIDDLSPVKDRAGLMVFTP